MEQNKYISIPKAAEIMGMDRTQLFRLIKAGKIPAVKIGRNYAINLEDLGIGGEKVSDKDKKIIDKTIVKIFHDYGDVIRKLGAE